ncbi:MAG: DUF6036 family nucleotidyltransferase [Candidatus Saliniplasma sp.]
MKLHEENKIKEIFRNLDEYLNEKVTAYLLGGGAMIYHGSKTATKDIDLVLDDYNQLTILSNTLKRIGYETVTELENQYEKLGAKTVLEKDGQPRFDIFLNIVCKKLGLSKTIKERSTEAFDLNNLTIKVLSKEDIFLFKVVATRDRDIEDASILVETGLNWKIILKETEAQSKITDRRWFPMLYQVIEELEEEYSQTCPVKEEIYQKAIADLEDIQ